MVLKPGTRLRSQVCDTQVVVIKAPAEGVELTCGGHPFVPVDAEPAPGLELAEAGEPGNLLGKRYTDADGTLELLVTAPGKGRLRAAGAELVVKEAKPLPSSD